MTEETLGKRIMSRRKALGLTQDALAEKLGITAQAVSKWENDQSCPDIAMLPRLAEIFNITTDFLLGVEKSPDPDKTEENPQQPEPEQKGTPGNCRTRSGIGVALWLVLSGAILVAIEVIPLQQCGIWPVLALTGLTLFGLFGIYPRFSVFRLGCALLGGYYLYYHLFDMSVVMNEELLIPILLVLFGLELLLGRNRVTGVPAGHWSGATKSEYHCEEEGFDCCTSFGEDHRVITSAVLQRGRAEVTFGELSVDLHGCAAIGENCRVRLRCCFGSLCLYVPRSCRVTCTNKAAFGTVQEKGAPDAGATQELWAECDVSFGEITICYT